MALTDRRGHPRLQGRGVRAWMFVNNGKPERCEIVDFSRKGVLVESPRMLLPGMKVELAFARMHGPKVTRVFRRWAQVTRSTRKSFAVFFVNRPQREVVRSQRI